MSSDSAASVRHSSSLIFAFLVAMCVPPTPAQTVAGFDDLPVPFPDFVLPTREPFDYQGLSWKGFYVIRSTHGLADNFPESGLRLGLVSGEFAAVAARRGLEFSEVSSPDGTKFTFLGAHLTAGWRRGLNVTLKGLSNGQAMSVKRLVIEPDGNRFVEVNFENIDTLQIHSEGGEDAGLCGSPVCEPGPEVVVDDFTFTFGGPVEPMTHVPSEALLASAQPAATPMPEPAAPVIEPKGEEASPATPPPSQPAAVPAPVAAPKPEPGPPPIPAEAPFSATACGSSPYHGVQVGAFRSKSNALNLRKQMASKFGGAQIHERMSSDAPFFVVVVGCHQDRGAAASQRQILSDAGVEGLLIRASVEKLGSVVSPGP